MATASSRFYARARPFLSKESDLPDFFAFHLTVELGQSAATVQGVRACYEASDLVAPSWLASHFSNGLRSKPRRFIKVHGGYRLEAARRDEIASTLDRGGVLATCASVSLGQLEDEVSTGPKRDFLHETILCYGAGANRAAVVMCWNLALHHLQDHVIRDPNRLAAFNAVLAVNRDSRVKIAVVGKQDDFTEMPESKFLEFCRAAKIITSSMFNKLEARLKERNSAAHPSGVTTTLKATEAYIEDLVENVLKKFAA